MNTLTGSLAPDVAPAGEPAAGRPGLPRWTREPLLHFLLLGAALFAADHFLMARTDDPQVIVIDAEVDEDASRVFKSARGRNPDPRELEALRRAWLDNEVLYREGMALGLDKGDQAIRDRLIFKALSVVDSNLKPPQATDAVLQAWFEKHRTRYDDPARFDFQEAVPAGEATEEAVRALVEKLNRGGGGEVGAGLRVFKDRPRDNVAQGYGETFLQALETAPVGEWRVYRTRDAWRAIRLEAMTQARPAQFEALRGVVLHDWTDATMAEQRTAAVRALANKYTVKIEGGAP